MPVSARIRWRRLLCYGLAALGFVYVASAAWALLTQLTFSPRRFIMRQLDGANLNDLRAEGQRFWLARDWFLGESDDYEVISPFGGRDDAYGGTNEYPVLSHLRPTRIRFDKDAIHIQLRPPDHRIGILVFNTNAHQRGTGMLADGVWFLRRGDKRYSPD